MGRRGWAARAGVGVGSIASGTLAGLPPEMVALVTVFAVAAGAGLPLRAVCRTFRRHVNVAQARALAQVLRSVTNGALALAPGGEWWQGAWFFREWSIRPLGKHPLVQDRFWSQMGGGSWEDDGNGEHWQGPSIDSAPILCGGGGCGGAFVCTAAGKLLVFTEAGHVVALPRAHHHAPGLVERAAAAFPAAGQEWDLSSDRIVAWGDGKRRVWIRERSPGKADSLWQWDGLEYALRARHEDRRRRFGKGSRVRVVPSAADAIRPKPVEADSGPQEDTQLAAAAVRCAPCRRARCKEADALAQLLGETNTHPGILGTITRLHPDPDDYEDSDDDATHVITEGRAQVVPKTVQVRIDGGFRIWLPTAVLEPAHSGDAALCWSAGHLASAVPPHIGAELAALHLIARAASDVSQRLALWVAYPAAVLQMLRADAGHEGCTVDVALPILGRWLAHGRRGRFIRGDRVRFTYDPERIEPFMNWRARVLGQDTVYEVLNEEHHGSYRLRPIGIDKEALERWNSKVSMTFGCCDEYQLDAVTPTLVVPPFEYDEERVSRQSCKWTCLLLDLDGLFGMRGVVSGLERLDWNDGDRRDDNTCEWSSILCSPLGRHEARHFDKFLGCKKAFPGHRHPVTSLGCYGSTRCMLRTQVVLTAPPPYRRIADFYYIVERMRVLFSSMYARWTRCDGGQAWPDVLTQALLANEGYCGDRHCMQLLPEAFPHLTADTQFMVEKPIASGNDRLLLSPFHADERDLDNDGVLYTPVSTGQPKLSAQDFKPCHRCIAHTVKEFGPYGAFLIKFLSNDKVNRVYHGINDSFLDSMPCDDDDHDEPRPRHGRAFPALPLPNDIFTEWCASLQEEARRAEDPSRLLQRWLKKPT